MTFFWFIGIFSSSNIFRVSFSTWGCETSLFWGNFKIPKHTNWKISLRLHDPIISFCAWRSELFVQIKLVLSKQWKEMDWASLPRAWMLPFTPWQEGIKKIESTQNRGSHQKVRTQHDCDIHQLRKSGPVPKIYWRLFRSFPTEHGAWRAALVSSKHYTTHYPRRPKCCLPLDDDEIPIKHWSNLLSQRQRSSSQRQYLAEFPDWEHMPSIIELEYDTQWWTTDRLWCRQDKVPSRSGVTGGGWEVQCALRTLSSQPGVNAHSHFLKKQKCTISFWFCLFVGCFFVPCIVFPVNIELP